jgi:hypothetical protein
MCLIGVASVIVIAFDIVPTVTLEDRAWGVLFSVLWSLFVFLASYSFLKMPTEIVVNDAGSIIMRSPIRTTSLKVEQITRLSYIGDDPDWMLYHTNGRFDLRNFRHNELNNFLEWVMRANPDVEMPEELKTQLTGET